MGISFSDDGLEAREPLVASSLLREDEGEYTLRPKRLAEYIGQEKAKENLSVFIKA
ncbi:MAG: Holliday junction branch migration DNA helicase RuvB, partial [Clostridiales bacterium]|nr:Holliday junction branch migration DNA helicase RuvB [Clostridiales bacterium]